MDDKPRKTSDERHAAIERLLARVPEVKEPAPATSRWTVREKKKPDPDSWY